MSGWTISLADPRSDSRSDGTHAATAEKLRMDRRATVEETLAAYVRGEDGRPPSERGARIDPVLAAVAAHHGIVPMRYLRAKHLGLGFGISLEHDDGAVTVFHDEYMPDIGGHVQVAPGITYSASLVSEPTITLLHEGGIPSTLRMALVGRRLEDLVAMPGIGAGPLILDRQEIGGSDHYTLERLPSVPCAQ